MTQFVCLSSMLNGCNMDAASVMPGGLKELSTDDPSLLREKFKPIDKTSLSEEISRQIMNLVSSGDLTPGQKLPSERELCTRFGVGRSSLREALATAYVVLVAPEIGLSFLYHWSLGRGFPAAPTLKLAGCNSPTVCDCG